VPAKAAQACEAVQAANPDLLGGQVALRKALRPVMSADQQRLCGYNMDGKPRLVRGVAGSGKTLVLAHWLQKTVQKLADRPDSRVWAVYANKSLHRLIEDTVEEGWRADGGAGPSPLESVQLHHVRDLLQNLFREAGLRMAGDDFDYDALAAKYLERVPFEKVRPRCQAMFIDEAQDMGPNTMKLLSALVEPGDASDPRARAVNIFYDNAQNIYGRSTPRWSEMGLDMRGRSTVMKESFRSTRPVTEYALNVLYRLQPPDADPDHKELVERGLVEQSRVASGPWWNVRFNQVEGPTPSFKKFASLEDQIDALGKQVVRWVRDEGVKPGDICILYNGGNVRWRLEQQVAPMLREIGYGFTFVGEQGWSRTEDAVLASTSHSYKGFESEVVVIAGVEQFQAKEKGILANNLYVAMTRARSLLAVYAYERKNPDENTRRLLTTLKECLDALLERPKVEREISNLDDFEDVLSRLGAKHRGWLEKLWTTYHVEQEPILADDGEILAEPLFWFKEDDRVAACFGEEGPGTHTLHTLEDHGIEVVRPGQE
jgi:ATP-dependent exoDNAse (exonuclease V) beta subunit